MPADKTSYAVPNSLQNKQVDILVCPQTIEVWYGNERYTKELRAIARADVLILDDFGLSKLDSQDRLSLLEILEDRWGKTSTVVVSQRPFATWNEVLGEPTVADAICDRLFANAERIELKGESLRKTCHKA